MNLKQIRAKATFRLPLTPKERALYLLFLANTIEAHDFLEWETAKRS